MFCYTSQTPLLCETIYYKLLCNQIRESEVRQNRLYDCGSFYVPYMNYNRTYVCVCQSEILPKMIGVRLIGHIYSFSKTIFCIPFGSILNMFCFSVNNLNCFTKSSQADATVFTSSNID